MDYISFIRSKVGQEKIILTYAAGILTDNKGRVLLQKRGDKGTWGIPGGFMELGESSVDTLIREFWEETGISVQPTRLLNVYTNFEASYPSGDVAQPIGIIYQVEATAAYDISNFRNEETVEICFFTKEEIANLPLAFEQHRVILEEFWAQDFKMGW